MLLTFYYFLYNWTFLALGKFIISKLAYTAHTDWNPYLDFIVLTKISIVLQVLKFSECKIKFIITLGGVKSFIS